jgi:hypothetical protein
MHRNGHGIGDADLFNDQVGKIGKYRHRLILAQENVSLEILFGPLFYHIAIIEAAEEPNRGSESFYDIFTINNKSDLSFVAKLCYSCHHMVHEGIRKVVFLLEIRYTFHVFIVEKCFIGVMIDHGTTAETDRAQGFLFLCICR